MKTLEYQVCWNNIDSFISLCLKLRKQISYWFKNAFDFTAQVGEVNCIKQNEYSNLYYYFRLFKLAQTFWSLVHIGYQLQNIQ